MADAPDRRTLRALCSRCRFFQFLGLAAGLVVWAASAVSAQPAFAPGLCLVTVKEGNLATAPHSVPYNAKAGEAAPFTQTLSDQVIMVPGLPLPILWPEYDSPQGWTISQANALVPFNGRFPSLYRQDQFAVESGSGRVLGSDVHGLYVFDPGSQEFRLLVLAPFGRGIGGIVSENWFREVNTIVQVARLGMTLIGTDNGVLQLKGDEVEALPGAGLRNVGDVDTIIDLPVHGAMLLCGPSQTWLRHDDGKVELLTDKGRIYRAFESRQPGRIVVEAAKTLLMVEMRPDADGFSPRQTQTLDASSRFPYTTELMTRSGEYLLFGRSSWFGFVQHGLERLEADGLHVAPGAVIPEDDRLWMREVPSRGLVLIKGLDGLYAYDGSQVRLIPGTAPNQIGIYDHVIELPSIGKVFLGTTRGLKELTADRTLAPAGPALSDLDAHGRWSELPAAHVALTAAGDTLLALTQSGLVLPIEGATAGEYDPGSFKGIIPVRNVMLVRGKTGLHLLADASQPGAPCPASARSAAP